MSYGSLTPIEGIHGGFFYKCTATTATVFVDDSDAPEETAPLLTISIDEPRSERHAHQQIRSYIDANEDELWRIDRRRRQ